MFLSTSSSSSIGYGLGGLNTAVLGNMRSLGGSLEKTLYAISTGYRVNVAADDPAGSVAINHSNAKLNALGVAIDNNQRSFAHLSGIDGAQKEILNVLTEIRNNAQRINGETDVTLRQTLIETVAAQLGALDTLAHSVEIGGKTALNGANKISLGDIASQYLDSKNTTVRTARDNAYLSIAFDTQNAARQARIEGDYNLPTAGSAVAFSISTQKGMKSVQISGGATDAEVIKQINKTLAGIGARAEIYTDNGGTKKIAFTTTGYGNDYRIEYQPVTGGIMSNATAMKNQGVSGTVRINAENYSLSGDYNNSASEAAKISGTATSGAINATNLEIMTTNGTATVSLATMADIAAAVAAINGDANVQNLGVRASFDNGVLAFTSREMGNAAVLSITDSAGALFASGMQSQTVTGKDYAPGDGLRVSYVRPEINSSLVFEYDKVATATSGGATYTPDDFAFTSRAKGGARFYTGDGVTFYDAINYSFNDLTSSGLGLDQLMKADSPLSLDKNTANALNYINWTISQVQKEYGALGSFMNYQLASTNEALQALESSTADGLSIIADADMAEETLKVVRYQILQQASMSALSSNANYAQMIASLFGQSAS